MRESCNYCSRIHFIHLQCSSLLTFLQHWCSQTNRESAWVTPTPVGQRVSGHWNEVELEELKVLFLVLPGFAQYLLPPTSPHHHSTTTGSSSWYRGRRSWRKKRALVSTHKLLGKSWNTTFVSSFAPFCCSTELEPPRRCKGRGDEPPLVPRDNKMPSAPTPCSAPVWL